MILLPENPSAREATPRLKFFGTTTRPQNGARPQTINRLGTRYSCAFEMPPMYAEPYGRAFVADLIVGKQEGAIMRLPTMGVDLDGITTAAVNGGSQSGTSLIADGFPANAVVPKGVFFTALSDGKRHLLSTAAEVTANGSGQATLTLTTMMRTSFTDNASLNFSNPSIEGDIVGKDLEWRLQLANFVGLSFEIEEI